MKEKYYTKVNTTFILNPVFFTQHLLWKEGMHNYEYDFQSQK